MTTITTRSGKGSPLSHTELDNNFTNLNTDKIEADSTDTLTNKTIDSASNTITVTESDISDLGSYLTTVAIDDVSDVTITTPADNEVLAYDSTSSTWINQTPAEAGLLSTTDVTASAAELNILDGATLTTAELNYVDGVTSSIQTQLDSKGTGTVSSLSDLSVTATAAELNKLDGATASTTELNYVTGVTSAIQTQLNAKGTVSSLTDLSVTATAAELNLLDGVTATTAELNYVDGVTSSIQTQLDSKTSYSDSSVDTHLNTSTASTNEVLSWTGTDYDWVAQSGGSSVNSFSTISANGTSVVADSSTDTVTFTAGSGITITGDASTDTITFASTGGGSGTGNITFSGYTIATDGDIDSSTTPVPGRMEIGTGYPDGNFGDSTYDAWGVTKYGVVTMINSVNPNEGTLGNKRWYGLTSELFAKNGSGSDTTNNTRLAGHYNVLTMVGANKFGATSVSRNNAGQDLALVGEGQTDQTGDVGHIVGRSITVGLGGTTSANNIDTAISLLVRGGDDSGSNGSTIARHYGIAFDFNGNGAYSSYSDDFALIHNQADNNRRSGTNHGMGTGLGSYYFIRNEDLNAQSKVGVLREYEERMRSISSSGGALSVSFTNSPTQDITLTENITSVTFSNAKTASPDSGLSMTHSQALLIKQGATGYSVTFPTGSGYYYAGGTNTITASANAHTWVMVNAVYNGSSTDYYISISPAFETV